MRSCRSAKLKWAYESFTGAISSTAIMKAYKPYRQRVTVTLKRQVASGWVNAYATKTTAISSITDPMVLQTFFSCGDTPCQILIWRGKSLCDIKIIA